MASGLGVLIIGARRGNAFVATEVLISADSLGEEEAIRAWLQQHDIHVGPTCSKPPPRTTLHAGDRLIRDTRSERGQ
jgi:hypothetical protein